MRFLRIFRVKNSLNKRHLNKKKYIENFNIWCQSTKLPFICQVGNFSKMMSFLETKIYIFQQKMLNN